MGRVEGYWKSELRILTKYWVSCWDMKFDLQMKVKDLAGRKEVEEYWSWIITVR